jgi:hypothetical protein
MRINRKQKLYVIPEGKGYSCLGFGVCADRSHKMADWLSVLRSAGRRGTKAAYAEYERLTELCRLRCEANRERCPIELTPQLIGLEGKRVEVVTSWGERMRFYVGKSTGWMPIHLAIARRDSTGGGGVVGGPFQSVKVLYAR